jgi:hypothetical protein
VEQLIQHNQRILKPLKTEKQFIVFVGEDPDGFSDAFMDRSGTEIGKVFRF